MSEEYEIPRNIEPAAVTVSDGSYGRRGLSETVERCLSLAHTNSSLEISAVEDRILSERIQIERKQFFFDLKENCQGRFLRITEDVGGRRNTIIVPSTGLKAFRDAIGQAIEVEDSVSNE